ncbi:MULTISPECIES: hypothetical protein [Neisseria]|uniref:Uncharacterized protein n=1 Tax=Neisseria dumasiana TaxID=1931275 RepID=A0A1X3DBY4_9NEIS|nr:MULTISPECIES: hypothetical protein [Neisseria]OSI17413.1 hypothetical protein BV912_11020 [Neisseria dumasiana]
MKFYLTDLYRAQSQAELRQRMENAVNVFHFAVWPWQQERVPDTAAYRAAIEAVFEHFIRPERDMLREQSRLYYENRKAEHEINHDPRSVRQIRERLIREAEREQVRLSLTLNIEEAHPAELDNDFLCPFEELKFSATDENQWFKKLFYHFCNPPYGLHGLTREEEIVLWQDFCVLVGLIKADKPIVTDWIQHQVSDRNLVTHPFSNYFDDGLDWWGVWCLTVFNPKNKTLAVIVASASD